MEEQQHEIEVEEVEHLPLEQVEEDPRNTRTRSWGDLAGLAQSIREVGQTTPGTVRPIGPGRWQIVVGARRRRACELAGIATFAAVVRELTDAQAHDIRLSENDQRENIDLIEEAEAFRVAIEEHGRTIDELAARLGRERRHIVQRLRILELVDEVRDWLDADKIAADAALAIAQLEAPVQERVAEALRWALRRDGRISREDVRRATQSTQSDLRSPGFDVDDAELAPGAGACGACPKRSGAQGVLFGVLERDVCLDPACFTAKLDATWERKSAAAKKAGLVVLEERGSVMAAISDGDHVRLDEPAYYLDSDGKATDLDAREVITKDADGIEVYDEEPNKPVSWRELLGEQPPITLARDRDGRAVELVSRDIAQQALERAQVGIDLPDARSSSSSSSGSASAGLTETDRRRREKERDARKKAKEREAIEVEGVRRGKAAVIAAVEAGNNDAGVLRALVLAACEGTVDGTLADVCLGRGWGLEDASTGERLAAREAITRNSVELDEARLAGLLADVIVSRSVASYRLGIKGTGFELVARAKGIDLAHHKREAEREAREQRAGVTRGGRAKKGKASKGAGAEASDAAE